MKSITSILAALCILGSCSARPNTNSPDMTPDTDTICLAGGCFWGTEHFLKQIRGVESTQAGYANSTVPSPSYREVCTGRTHAAEAVLVKYDPGVLSLDSLLALYFLTIDPTSVDRQGNDTGTQYRTGIYYTDRAQRAVAEKALKALGAHYNKPLAVELLPLDNFHPAEDYHQDYLDNNPGGYCHINPRLFEIARRANAPQRQWTRPSDDSLRRSLTPIQYEVTQRNATEPPFANEYYDETRRGIYVDVTTGEPLFVSTDKFDSGCGWPAFSQPLPSAGIVEKTDRSHGMVRTEVRSAAGDAHLGHVFNDGPAERGGLRYCINSAALRFIPLDEMEAQGYGDYVKYVK